MVQTEPFRLHLAGALDAGTTITLTVPLEPAKAELPE